MYCENAIRECFELTFPKSQDNFILETRKYTVFSQQYHIGFSNILHHESPHEIFDLSSTTSIDKDQIRAKPSQTDFARTNKRKKLHC